MKIEDRPKVPPAQNVGFIQSKKFKKRPQAANQSAVSKSRATSTSSREERLRSVTSFEHRSSHREYPQ